MNLYKIEYELVSSSATKEEVEYLPTHVIASNQSNAVESALNYSSRNFQLKRVYLESERVNVIKESLK